MGSFESSTWDDSSSEDDYDINEEEDVALVLMMHKNKRPNHAGSIFGH